MRRNVIILPYLYTIDAYQKRYSEKIGSFSFLLFFDKHLSFQVINYTILILNIFDDKT